jgi:eukaryotic-like serine/threonine-protein kinase
MHGNVREWCQDDYDYVVANYNNAPTDGSPIIKSNSSTKGMRGGSWNDNFIHCRSAVRNGVNADLVNRFYGFRVVLF